MRITGTQAIKVAAVSGGVVNFETGEILNVYDVPSKYLRYVELDEMGYTTLPDDQFSELRNELTHNAEQAAVAL